MAGHASNWFKIGSGTLKGRAVYVSKAQQNTMAWPSAIQAFVQKYIDSPEGQSALLDGSAKSFLEKPKGVALAKLALETVSSAPTTVMVGTRSQGTFGVGEAIAVPAAGASKHQNAANPAGGTVRATDGDFALVQSGDVYHVVNTKTGAPVSLHHGSEAAARAAFAKANTISATATFQLPSPTTKMSQVSGTGFENNYVSVEDYNGLGLYQTPFGWNIRHEFTGVGLLTSAPTKEIALLRISAGLQIGVDWKKKVSVANLKVHAQTMLENAIDINTNSLLGTPLLNPTAKHGVNDVFNQASSFDAWENGQTSIGNGDGINVDALAKFSAPWLAANPVSGLSVGQRKAMTQYQSNSYKKMYGAIMAQTPQTATPAMQKSIKALDTFMGKTTMPVNLVATRSKGAISEDYRWAAQLQVGGEFRPPTYQGASVSSPKTNWKDPLGKGVRFHYRMPKGSKGTGSHVDIYTKQGMEQEAEFLVHRNTRWKVSAKTVSPNGRIEVVLDYIGPGDDKPGEWTTGGRPVRNP